MTPSRSNTTPWKASARARPSATVDWSPSGSMVLGAAVWRPPAPACYKHGHAREPECGRTMVAAAPFRGLRFDPDVVGEHAQGTAPPHAVPSPARRAAPDGRRRARPGRAPALRRHLARGPRRL